MPNLDVPMAAHFLTGSILTLVMPLAVVIVMAIWYFTMWRGGMGER
jgi:preprotein translocase subunit YajC